jgi:DNA processing protein
MTTPAIEGACRACMRRTWLLSKLSARLDYRVKREESRVLELLELEDRELIEAIGGRWRTELRERWERFELDDKSDEPDAIDKLDADGLGADAGVETVCRHCLGYPSALRARRGAPRVLHVVGGAERLGKLTAGPAVAIVGSERPTDYGMEMAHSLARGLAASGVTVVSGFANGIAAGAHAGALEVRGPTVTVMAGGVDVVRPAARRGLYERVRARGCAVAEPPCGYLPRRWCRPARARTIAGLVGLTIVVEADEGPRELIGVHAARALGQVVAAVPGRVTSPVSRGTNALLMAGAPLVRGPADALDLLYGVGAPGLRGAHPRGSAAPAKAAKLEPRLQAMLEQVGAGRDTAGKLTSAGEDPGETMLALAELELMGLLGRGDGGRYVPRESLAGR